MIFVRSFSGEKVDRCGCTAEQAESEVETRVIITTIGSKALLRRSTFQEVRSSEMDGRRSSAFK